MKPRVLLRVVCVTAIFLAITSCSVAPVSVKDERLIMQRGADVGFLVGSIGRVAKGSNKSIASKNQLRIRNLDTGANFELTHSGDFMYISPVDIEEGNIKASLFRVPLPPGDYEIYKAYFFFSSGYVVESYQNAENFSFLFKMEVGKEVYIGESIASSITEKSLFGLPVVVGYRFDISDRQQRDFELLKARFADFSPANTSVYIPAKAIVLDGSKMTIVPTEVPVGAGLSSGDES
jgi:hypothetical protein